MLPLGKTTVVRRDFGISSPLTVPNPRRTPGTSKAVLDESSLLLEERQTTDLVVYAQPETADRYAAQATGPKRGALCRFTPLQTSILDLVARGSTDKQLAMELGISRSTVHTYLDRMFRRYDVHTRTALVAIWLTSRR